MAKKKKQHYVPEVYLKAFVDHEPPEGWPADRPFEPAVWVLDPTLTGKPRRKAPSNILWENSLYTLASDDPDAPWLEESLSRLENAYKPVLDCVVGGEPLSDEQYGILLLFLGALYGRVPSQLDHWQRVFDKIQGISKQMSDLPPHGMSWSDFEESGKRSLEFRTGGYAEVVAPHGFVLHNQTPMPFVTSDNPVLHVFLHTDELPVSSFPEEIRAGVGRNIEAFFAFVPLTPAVAFVSSPLLSRGAGLHCATEDTGLVLALNQYTRHTARAVISQVPRPYGPLTDEVIAQETANSSTVPKRSGLLLYTSDDRLWIASTVTNHGMGDHPLQGRLEFVVTDREGLSEVAVLHEITEVRVYSEGRQVGGMRDAWLSSVGLAEDQASVIENWPGGWSAWIASTRDSYGA